MERTIPNVSLICQLKQLELYNGAAVEAINLGERSFERSNFHIESNSTDTKKKKNKDWFFNF